jgi:hypothetical protein
MVVCVRSGPIGKHPVTNDAVDRNRLDSVCLVQCCALLRALLVQGLRQSVVGMYDLPIRGGNGNASKCLVRLEKEGLVVYVIAGLLLRLPYRRSSTTVLDYWLLELRMVSSMQTRSCVLNANNKKVLGREPGRVQEPMETQGQIQNKVCVEP